MKTLQKQIVQVYFLCPKIYFSRVFTPHFRSILIIIYYKTENWFLFQPIGTYWSLFLAFVCRSSHHNCFGGVLGVIVGPFLNTLWFFGTSKYHQCVTVHMSCHKAIVVIIERTHCFHDNIYIMLIFFLWDFSTRCVVNHIWPLMFIRI